MKGKTLLTVLILIAVATVGYHWLPPYYNPFIPLTLDDPPGRITQYKLRRLTPEACTSLLSQANQRALIRSQPVANSGGACPLNNVVRVRDFGPVSLNSSFLASCPLALGSALYIHQQARPLTKRFMGSDLTRIDHLGSFACRNIYHRPDARRSEHATAEALDIAAFRLANGERVTVLNGWKGAKTQPWLKAMLAASCGYYGNGLGPEYNAAHADHFHLGMRGFGLCR
ncbi:extensin-like domain-containing protein [Enterobacter sichuanensis]|uniref:extensin-like domain-containing protein n=1 Tax=Enterobacter sichuanensis TaxID=2071710 RepID=UPI00217EEB7E|nr:extensin family protein [Enterobacter sichuanensis]